MTHEDEITARWVDIEDPKAQFEAAFGIKLEKWEWDYIEHLRRGERLVPKGRHGSEWVKDERLEPTEGGDAAVTQASGEKLDPEHHKKG